jgi:hypothetical protein
MSRSKGPTAWGNRERGGLSFFHGEGDDNLGNKDSESHSWLRYIYVFVGFDEKRAQLSWSRGSGPAVLVTETRGLSRAGLVSQGFRGMCVP